MRHAEAAPGYPDQQRVLTARGLNSLSQMPEALALSLADVEHILVSPYLRTRQTIEQLLPGRTYQLSDALVPESSPQAVAQQLAQLPDDAQVLLVTHMPLVGALSVWLKEGASGYPESFITAQVEELVTDFPAAGLATQLNLYYLQ